MFYKNTLIYPWILEFSPNERDIIKKFFELINLGLEKLELQPKSDVIIQIQLLCFIYFNHRNDNHLECSIINERMMELINQVIEKENEAIKPLCWSKVSIKTDNFPITVILENNFNHTTDKSKKYQYLIKIRSEKNITTERIYHKTESTIKTTVPTEHYL